MQSDRLDAVSDEIRAFGYTHDVETEDPSRPRKIPLSRDTVDDGYTLRSAYSAKEEGSVYFSVTGALSRSSSGFGPIDDDPVQRQDSNARVNACNLAEESITTLFPEDAFADEDTCDANSEQALEEVIDREAVVGFQTDEVRVGKKELQEEGEEDMEHRVQPPSSDGERNAPCHEAGREGPGEEEEEEEEQQHQQSVEQNMPEDVTENPCREAETVGPILSLPCEGAHVDSDEKPQTHGQQPHIPCQECMERRRDVEMYQHTIQSLRSTIATMAHDAQDQILSLEEDIRLLKVQHTEQVSSLLRENSSLWKELRRFKFDQKHPPRGEERVSTSCTMKKSKPKIVIPVAPPVSQDVKSPPGYSPLAAGRLMHYNSTP